MTQTPNYEIPTEMRDFAEKSVEQARKAFDSFIGAARKTSDTLQGSAEMARNNAQDVSSRGFSFAERNVNAAFDLAQKLVRSRDAALADKLAEQLSASLAAVDAIPVPFDNAIMNDAGRAKVTAAVRALQAQTETLVEVATLFGIEINLE